MINRPLTSAEARELDRLIGHNRRRNLARDAAIDRRFDEWVDAERTKFSPEELAELDAAAAARRAQERADEQAREDARERARHDPYSTFGT